MTSELTRAERRQLRRIERGVLTTDRAWAESAFGSATRQRLRRRAAVTAAADVAAVTALGFSVATASIPMVFAGIVLANVAICCHFDGSAKPGQEQFENRPVRDQPAT